LCKAAPRKAGTGGEDLTTGEKKRNGRAVRPEAGRKGGNYKKGL